eukprot:TRINITY_DN495_c0_g2_i3.p1 TRINITY_DN495_c0_g2~~TRINITY_DN495_c0_g2_i3.p1  ORF type:complete len:205 (+),score=48.62 TRINITY_DN495_c0_g2_i3:372-986(+)
MLDIGKTVRGESSQGDTLEADMGTGISFRPGTFDGCISISALQWLCESNSSDQVPIKRINRFFNSLYGCMIRGGRCIFQFYPENPKQVELLTTAALKAGFTGGMLVDYPNSTKAKKYFLVLFAGMLPGQALHQQMPVALGTEEGSSIKYESDRKHTKDKKGQIKGKPAVKSKEWIKNKKERRTRQGKDTVGPSAYTARNRGPKF